MKTLLAGSFLMQARGIDATFGHHEQILSLLRYVRESNAGHEDNLELVHEVADCFAGITREQAERWLRLQVWVLGWPDLSDPASFKEKAEEFAGGDLEAMEFYAFSRGEELQDLLDLPAGDFDEDLCDLLEDAGRRGMAWGED